MKTRKAANFLRQQSVEFGDEHVSESPLIEVSVACSWDIVGGVSLLITSDDPGYIDGRLWNMHGDELAGGNTYGSAADEAWASGFTGHSSVVVGVVDTGIDYTHPDLYLNVWLNQREIPSALRPILIDIDTDGLITIRDLNAQVNSSAVSDINANGFIDAGDLLRDGRWCDGTDADGNGFRDDLIGWDFVNGDNDPYDDNGHGTHVSGTVGAVGGNALGVVGINWNVQMVALKFLSASGMGGTADAARAIDWFTSAATRASPAEHFVATNNSWGGGGFSSTLSQAVNRAAQRDIIFVAAAGNSSQDNDATPNYPANLSTTAGAGYEAVISVAALTSSGGLASFSNYGAATVDLAAPGTSILSTTPNGNYASFNGTSMAAPHVTGAIALYAASNPLATAAQIRAALLGSTALTPALVGKTVTGGRLDIGAMMGTDAPPTLSVTSDTQSRAEGDAGTVTAFTFTVTRSGDASQTSSVTWAVSGSGVHQTDAADFAGNTLPGGFITFSAGETAKTIRVNVAGDAQHEDDEEFVLSLSNASAGTTIARATAIATVLDDDTPTLVDTIRGDIATTSTLRPTLPQQSAIETSGDEDWFAITLVAGRHYDLALDAATGSALDPLMRLMDATGQELMVNDDAVGTNARLSFDATTSGTYFVSAGGWSITTGSYALSMAETWVPPSLSISQSVVSRTEGTTGTTTPFTFTVTRSGDTSETSSAVWTVSGSGSNQTNAADFVGNVMPSGLVSLAPGETTKTIVINVAGDTQGENDEGFLVTLSDASAGTSLGQPTASGVILNDDRAISIAAVSADKPEGNKGRTPFTFSVTRSGDTRVSTSVRWAVSGSGLQSASAADFFGGALPSGTIKFAPKETQKTITVSVAGDTIGESDESFIVTLSNATIGTAILQATAIGTIINDDPSLGNSARPGSRTKGDNGSSSHAVTTTPKDHFDPSHKVNRAVNWLGATPGDASGLDTGVSPEELGANATIHGQAALDEFTDLLGADPSKYLDLIDAPSFLTDLGRIAASEPAEGARFDLADIDAVAAMADADALTSLGLGDLHPINATGHLVSDDEDILRSDMPFSSWERAPTPGLAIMLPSVQAG